MTETLEECRRTNQFPQTWKETEIRWIWKGKDDPMFIKHYRPIALAVVSYKIFMRIMASRLETVVEMEHLLADEQQGFRADRSCHAAALTLEIIKGRRLKQNKPLHIAYLDISKAYDTVHHEILFQNLMAKGISGQYIENLREMYSNNILRSMTPMGKTQGVPMNRGIRQGCPLSPLLFALYVDEMAEVLRKLNSNPQEPSMLLYADDMVIWAESQEELQAKLTEVARVMKKLKLQLSLEKTEVQHNKYQTPDLTNNTYTLPDNLGTYTYAAPTKPIRYLGIWSTVNMNQEEGMKKLKAKMEERMLQIISKCANPYGKTKLTRGKVCSVWAYTISIQEMTTDTLEEWDQIIAQAILGFSKERTMKRELLYYQGKKEGME